MEPAAVALPTPPTPMAIVQQVARAAKADAVNSVAHGLVELELLHARLVVKAALAEALNLATLEQALLHAQQQQTLQAQQSECLQAENRNLHHTSVEAKEHWQTERFRVAQTLAASAQIAHSTSAEAETERARAQEPCE